MQINNRIFTFSRPFSKIVSRKEGWVEGCVVTRHGIVSVYAQGSEGYDHYTRLDFAAAGKWYIREIRGKRYSVRGIVTKAKEFAAEIAAMP